MDWRYIANGYEIPSEGYCDQPYIVIADDGAWICTMTTGAGVEGEAGQHVIIIRSEDKGKTWSEPIPIEPADGPEASYSTLLKAPGGRLFCFYDHNTDNTRAVKADDPPYPGGLCKRVDSQGYFVFKYSDDDGRTWSSSRYNIPMREFQIDRENPYGGAIKYFWNVGRAFIHNASAYVPVSKVGNFGHGFFTRSEGALLKSDNLLTQSDPEKIVWATLPDGDIGLRTPPGGGPIAEEHSFIILSDGSFCCVYRTIDGHPCEAYSRDGGHTWTQPRYRAFASGRLMRHPRAANFHWPLGAGRYLYWFHNHGEKWYDGRNPVFVSGGVEADGEGGKVILWSEPEILLYDDDPSIRMSYPDLVIEDGRYFVTETQKTVARVHEIPAAFIEMLLGQHKRDRFAQGETLIVRGGETVKMPTLPSPRSGQGFAIDILLKESAPGALFDARDNMGKGIALLLNADGSVEGVINDGKSESRQRSTACVGAGSHLAFLCDGASKVMCFVIDGCFDDGIEGRPYGWGRMDYYIGDVNGASAAVVGAGVRTLRLYDRMLYVTEAVGNARAYRKEVD